MPSRHLTEEEQIAYAEDESSVPGAEEHLKRCSACREGVAQARDVIAGMHEREPWEAQQVREDELVDLVDFKERLVREDAEADRLLDPIVDEPLIFSGMNILKRRQFHTGGVVRQLAKLAREKVDDDPLFAQQLADAARTIAELLPDDYYPARLVNDYRGLAQKEYATTCRYLGEFTQGHEALDRAEEAYNLLPEAGTRLAAIKLARAILFLWQRLYALALPLAKAAALQYHRHGQDADFFEAKQVEAVILHRLGDLSAAVGTYKALLETATRLGDAASNARAAKNLGLALIERGQFAEAGQHLFMALKTYGSLDKPAMVLRCRHAIAYLTLSSGRAAEAAMQLRTLRVEFHTKGMLDDAQEAGLHLAEALAILKKWNELTDVCSQVFEYYRNQPVLTGALTALSYLKEAVAARRVTRADIRSVRQFLGDVRLNPNLPFVSPPKPGDAF